MGLHYESRLQPYPQMLDPMVKLILVVKSFAVQAPG